jgi:hypothetical protein
VRLEGLGKNFVEMLTPALCNEFVSDSASVGRTINPPVTAIRK